MAHVLIGFAEALPAPEVVFSLLAAGHRVSAFARGADCPLRRLPLVALHVLPDPGADRKARGSAPRGTGPAPAAAPAREADPGTAGDADWGAAAVRWLRGLMTGPGAPDLVLPLDDAGLWLVSHALGDDFRIAGARGDRAAFALDKIRQFEAARQAGLAVPETHVPTAPGDLPETLPLPGLLKPALALDVGPEGIRKGETLYLMAPEDRARAAALLARADQPYVVQPLVHGTGEGVFGFAGPQGVTAWFGHRRLRMMNPHGSGASACEACPPDADTRAAVDRFLTGAGWRGPFMMEFLRDPQGRLWFMELNGRMWGSLALARRHGFEYPAWAVQAAQEGEGFAPHPLPRPPVTGPVRHLGRDLLHLLFVLRGPKSAFHRAGWPSFRQSLAGVLKPAPARQFYNRDPAHRGYLLADTLWTVKKALRR